MPKYTSRVLITRKDGSSDEIMFDNFKAKSQKKARRITSEQAAQYLLNCAREPNPPLKWAIVECIRTALTNKPTKGVQQAIDLTENSFKPYKKPEDPPPLKIKSKVFKQEHHGSLLDAILKFDLPRYDYKGNTL